MEPDHAATLVEDGTLDLLDGDLYAGDPEPVYAYLRAHRPAMLVQDAARELFAEEGGSAFAAALVKEFGLHPPGDVVQLKSGERAVVLRRGATVGTPLVAAITNRSGMPIVQTVRRDTSRSEFAIAGAVRDQRFVLRMPPERLFGLPM